MQQVGTRGWRSLLPAPSLLLLVALAYLVAAPGASAAGPAYPDAVLLVSGYNSSTPFTTPAAGCAGQEGGTWGNPDGPAAALRDAGLDVFTAPVRRGNDPIDLSCTPGGTPAPGPGTYIDSFGDNDANGAALASLLAFLRDNYGVERIQLVAHSDGGNWSRSALTQDASFAGLDVRSLTTLGTPYTGSMVADIGTELRNGRCDFSDAAEQDLCEAFLVVAKKIYGDMGPTAIEQLTHSYLEGWNAAQSIGACPVTTIGGTRVDLPLLPFSFYNPSDGLVGEASALAHSAFALPDLTTIPAPDIPGLVDGGTYPVVHAPSLSFISPDNLLNTEAISSEVTSVVGATPTGPLCNGSAEGATGSERSSRFKHRAPFRLSRTPSRRGWLGKTLSGDVVVARPGVAARCDGADLDLVPLLGDRRLRIGYPEKCKGPVRTRTTGKQASRARKGRPAALLFRAHPRADLVVKRDGRRLRIKVSGARVRKLRVKVRADGAAKRLKLSRNGRAKLPRGDGSATLVARGRIGPASQSLDSTLVLSR